MFQQNAGSYDSFGNAFKRGFLNMPTAIRTIIGINVAVFVLQAIFGVVDAVAGLNINSVLVQYLGFDPSFPTFLIQPWRLITYTFLHAGFLHILFNMLWLWWMGQSVEQTVGPRSFTVIYFGAGILGALVDALLAMVFGEALVIGASGSVTGILVAFAVLYPRAPIMLFLFPPIEARYFVAGWIALDILFIGSGDNVARLVHLGGALGGYLLVKAHMQGNDLSVFIRYIEYLIGKFKPGSKPRNKNMSIVSDAEIVEEVEQSELDRILEKISKKGYESLSAEEKKKLFELSKKD